MTTLLAIDTATDALSVALASAAELRVAHQVMPRQHQQKLFTVLEQLTGGVSLASLNLAAIVYGRGPGSFTGLRIGVSAAQGLGYSLGVPLIGLSSLETQARTLLRREEIGQPCILLSTIDARIGQVYAQAFAFDGEQLAALAEPFVAAPEALSLPRLPRAQDEVPLLGLGTGYRLRSDMSPHWRDVDSCWPDLLPEAEDMLAPARDYLAEGKVLEAQDAVPDYVQQRIGWKTLAEQGRKT